MGIINLTPDSFYDGGKYINPENAIKCAQKMIDQGVDIIDLGACSSRPGSKLISVKQEEKRLFPVLNKLRNLFPEITISIDTFRSKIAENAINYGANIINDIYVEKEQRKMFEVIAKHQIPYIMMHMHGKPYTMQENTFYDNFKNEILNFFKQKINLLMDLKFNKIIIDPGIGFGKNLSQNYQLINMIPDLLKFKYPVLIGASRKSMIQNTLNIDKDQALNGTTIINTMAILKGAKIIRVHDVKEAKEIIQIYKLINTNK
ncbi:MAG: dihydropteroate synthase [Flavobacteriales bacterium]|nr:dihydropteroate synthase [Flavobacteriales bacterium]